LPRWWSASTDGAGAAWIIAIDAASAGGRGGGPRLDRDDVPVREEMRR